MGRGYSDGDGQSASFRRGIEQDHNDRDSFGQSKSASRRSGRLGPPRARDDRLPSRRKHGDWDEVDPRRKGEARSERIVKPGASEEQTKSSLARMGELWRYKDILNKHANTRYPRWNLDGKHYLRKDDQGSAPDGEREPHRAKSTESGPDRRVNGHKSEAPRSFQSGPESLPYTTAASEFIYGHSSVIAAIKANRRKLYKLYIHSQRGKRDGLMTKIRAHKLFAITSEVGDEYLQAMDKASSGRPHNGVVLESSPLPVPPIVALKSPSMEDQNFGVALDAQTAEDTLVNGRNELYSYKSGGWRHPLILYIDGVLDEGNLGAMARSAYFLGVDAIVTSTHHIAPWSHIALKASAGAAEAIPIFKVGKPADFLAKSSEAGWKIYSSNTAPPAPPSNQSPETEISKVVYTLPQSSKRLDVDHCPVVEHPTILMMGAESSGLQKSLLRLAHYNVGIPHGRDVNEVGVDSLNVSVAASLLCYEMLQRPRTQPDLKSEDLLF